MTLSRAVALIRVIGAISRPLCVAVLGPIRRLGEVRPFAYFVLG